jgi:hypothetical protein
MRFRNSAAIIETMAEILVKPVAGILSARRETLSQVLDLLAPGFGGADVIGQWCRFDHTDYYRDEMGEELWRCFVSFERLVLPEATLCFKSLAAEAEQKFSHDGRRVVNIDPGYLDTCKLVLMSGKHGGHKIALGSGIYADPLLWYDKKWKALPWAFPDFCDGSHFESFSSMRCVYKAQLKIRRSVRS